MAGPWFVDPENGLTTNNGLSADTPWKLIPGQTNASSQTGYGVVSGDVVNIKNGSTTTLRIIPPATNMTFRGYGLASNVLSLTLPSPRNPANRITRRVAREWGVHEGMWTIDMAAINGSAIGATGNAPGCVFEDVNIQGPSLLGTHSGIEMGTSGSSGALTGFTLRRFRIANQNNRGMSMYMINLLIEWGLIEYTNNDNITLWATTGSTSRNGSVDRIRNVEFREPNRLNATAEVGTDGDFVQTIPVSNAYNATTIIENCTGYKTNTAKQGTVLLCTSSGAKIEVKGLHLYGGGSTQMLVGPLAGSAEYSDIYFEDACPTDLPLFRFDPTGASVAYAMDTGSSLTIRNIIGKGVSRGLYSAVHTGSNDFDGAINIDGVTLVGANEGTLSYASTVSLWSSTSGSTFGDNFQLNMKNVCDQLTGKPHVILPASTANDSRFSIQSNAFLEGEFRIGATSYASLAAFEAAHSAATDNITDDPQLTDAYRPRAGSPLLGAGTHLGYTRDIAGVQRPNPPSIGAFDAATLREPV
jgi:hypothetical protein